MSLFAWLGFCPKYKEVAYGWPEYSNHWYIYEIDEKTKNWRITKDDLFADPRPENFSISERAVNFAENATPAEREHVQKLLHARLENLKNQAKSFK